MIKAACFVTSAPAFFHQGHHTSDQLTTTTAILMDPIVYKSRGSHFFSGAVMDFVSDITEW